MISFDFSRRFVDTDLWMCECVQPLPGFGNRHLECRGHCKYFWILRLLTFSNRNEMRKFVNKTKTVCEGEARKLRTKSAFCLLTCCSVLVCYNGHMENVAGNIEGLISVAFLKQVGPQRKINVTTIVALNLKHRIFFYFSELFRREFLVNRERKLQLITRCAYSFDGLSDDERA